VSVEELDGSVPQTVWDHEPDHVKELIDGIDPADAAEWIGPEVGGGSRWIFAPMQPGSDTQFHTMPGIDENGFHTTRTVDFDFVIDGEITLVLDEGSEPLQRGDFVILQAARHSWKNDSDRAALLLCLLHRPEGV
jgi:hypothetical protein